MTCLGKYIDRFPMFFLFLFQRVRHFNVNIVTDNSSYEENSEVTSSTNTLHQETFNVNSVPVPLRVKPC